MITDALDKTLNTICAEEDVIGVRVRRNRFNPYVVVIADAKWRPEIKEDDDHFLFGETAMLKVRITEALKPHGYIFSGQDVNVYTRNAELGIIEWVFVGPQT